MKNIILIVCIAAASIVHADERTDAIVTNLLGRLEKAGWDLDSLEVGLDRLDRWYQANLDNDKFREQLNGKVVRVVTDTNTLTKTFWYENGTSHVVPFKVKTPTSLEQKLSAAELKAKREEAARKKAEADEQARRDRIAALEDPETFAAETSALMKSKGYPKDLAETLLRFELSKLKAVTVVDGIVTPQE